VLCTMDRGGHTTEFSEYGIPFLSGNARLCADGSEDLVEAVMSMLRQPQRAEAPALSSLIWVVSSRGCDGQAVPVALCRLVRSAQVSVNAQKNGRLCAHPMGKLSGMPIGLVLPVPDGSTTANCNAAKGDNGI
jgi:hypothetical protein